MPAALKNRAKRGASAAEPQATALMLSNPSAVLTLLKTSFRASPSCHSYQAPFCPSGSQRSAQFERPIEDSCLHSACGAPFVDDSIIKLFKKSWNGCEDGWLGMSEVFFNRLQTFREVDIGNRCTYTSSAASFQRCGRPAES